MLDGRLLKESYATIDDCVFLIAIKCMYQHIKAARAHDAQPYTTGGKQTRTQQMHGLRHCSRYSLHYA